MRPGKEGEKMAIRIVRLGSARAEGEGVRIGAVRRVPRGVPKGDYARRDFFDRWLPELAPNAGVVAWALSEPFTPKRWAQYRRTYLREMKQPPAERLIALLAALSAQANFSVGCYCKDESRCHRSILQELLIGAGAVLVE